MRTETGLQGKHRTRRAVVPVTGRASREDTPTPGAPLPAYGTARPGTPGPYRPRETGGFLK